MMATKPHKFTVLTGFQDKYITLETLGQGTFGIVKKCRDKKTKDEFAVKIIKSRVINSRIENETQICAQLEHPHIVRLHYVYSDDMQYYMVFDLVTGGELFEDIVKREYYSESEASKCMHQILDAVAYCHDKNIIHRDIKPENLLLKNKESNSPLKLGNFGLALNIPEYAPGYHKIAGTLGYFAPELVNKQKYGKPVDLWACGVILYILLVGYPPFWDDNEKALSKVISRGEYEFYSPEWDSVTDKAKSLINRLLTCDPDKRITAKSALQHPWVHDREHFASKIHHQDTIQGLQKFNAKLKLKGAILSTICTNRLSHLLNDKQKAANSKSKKMITGSVSRAQLGTSSIDETLFKEIISVTSQICEALVSRDREVSNSLCAENFTNFEPDLSVNFGDTIQVTIVNPNVKRISVNSACISYSKLIQYINEANVYVTNQSLETRIWENSESGWKCVHLHSS